MKKIFIIIIFLVISYICLNEIFASVQTNKFSLEDIDVTSKEYQELEDRMSEVEDNHQELYDTTTHFFWGEGYQYQCIKATGKKEAYFYIPYIYADTSDVLTSNTTDWRYYFGILAYKGQGELIASKIKMLDVELKKDKNTDILWPVLPELTGKNTENIQCSIKDMEYFEAENEYVLEMKVATRDSSIQQNHSTPLKLSVIGSFEKKKVGIFQNDEIFKMEIEMQYLNNVT